MQHLARRTRDPPTIVLDAVLLPPYRCPVAHIPSPRITHLDLHLTSLVPASHSSASADPLICQLSFLFHSQDSTWKSTGSSIAANCTAPSSSSPRLPASPPTIHNCDPPAQRLNVPTFRYPSLALLATRPRRNTPRPQKLVFDWLCILAPTSFTLPIYETSISGGLPPESRAHSGCWILEPASPPDLPGSTGL